MWILCCPSAELNPSGYRNPATTRPERKRMLIRMADPDGLLLSVQQALASQILDPESDLKVASKLLHDDHNSEGYRRACRDGRAMNLRLSADLRFRLQDVWLMDPMEVIQALSLETQQERVDFFAKYLKSCYHCKHALCGRRLIDRGITPEELAAPAFLEPLEEACEDSPIVSSIGVEKLHTSLRSVVQKAVSKRKSPHTAFTSQKTWQIP